MSQNRFTTHRTSGSGLNARTFGAWHDQYRERLLNSMTSVVRDRDTAEDVTSTALAAAWRNLKRFRGDASLATWVYRIALHEALRQKSQRKAVSLDALEFPLIELSQSDSVNDAPARDGDRSRLKNALNAVPQAYRDVLTDHFILEHPVKRIARRRRTPVGTVLSRIFTAKRLLRRAWETTT